MPGLTALPTEYCNARSDSTAYRVLRCQVWQHCLKSTALPGLTALPTEYCVARSDSTAHRVLRCQVWQHCLQCTAMPGLTALLTVYCDARSDSTAYSVLWCQVWQHCLQCTAMPGLTALPSVVHCNARPLYSNTVWQHHDHSAFTTSVSWQVHHPSVGHTAKCDTNVPAQENVSKQWSVPEL